jgi:hypothetical protein
LRPSQPGSNVFTEERARTIFRIAKAFIEDFHNVENDIVTNQVAQFERSHRMVVAEFADSVDAFFGSNAFHEGIA